MHLPVLICDIISKIGIGGLEHTFIKQLVETCSHKILVFVAVVTIQHNFRLVH